MQMAVQRRYYVYVGLFLLMFINYLDRINLSVAAKDIAATYGLSPVELGFMFSSFLWTYLIFLVPMGLAADRFGGRAITYTTLGLWSLAGIWTGLTTSYASLFASRLALGIGESASYPSGGKIIREWAPASERGLATAFLNCGAYAGLSIGSIVVAWLITKFGWRDSFFITGAMGLVLAGVWFLYYRRPEQANWLSTTERQRILASRDSGGSQPVGDFNQRLAMRHLLSSRSMWSLAITQGCAGYTLYLFMTWLPNYLAVSRGFDALKSGLFSAVPYGMAVIIGLGLGWLSDKLIARSGGHNGERRKLIAVILLLSSVILATPFVDSIWMILALFSLSLGCVSTAMAMNIALTSDLVTDGRYNGVAVSILIMGGNLFGLAAPIITGYIVHATSGFSGAFLIAGVLLLTGAAVITTGAKRPIEFPESASPELKSLKLA
ncbi:MFS family permease [Nitrobacteraceae bacterium AZCC 2146]